MSKAVVQQKLNKRAKELREALEDVGVIPLVRPKRKKVLPVARMENGKLSIEFPNETKQQNKIREALKEIGTKPLVKPKQKTSPKFTIKPVQKFPISKEELKKRSERRKNIRQFVNYYNFLKRSGQQTQVVYPVKQPRVIVPPLVESPKIGQQPKVEIKPVTKTQPYFRRTIPPIEETRRKALTTYRPNLTYPELFRPNKVMEEEIVQERIPQREYIKEVEAIPTLNREEYVKEVLPVPEYNERVLIEDVKPIPEYHEKALIKEVTPIPEYHESSFIEEVKPIPEYHEFVQEVQPIPEYHFEEIRPVIIKNQIPYPVFTPVQRPVISQENAFVLDNKLVPRIVDTSRNYKDDGEVTVISPFSRLIIKSKNNSPQSVSSVGILPIYSNIPAQIQELFISTPEMNMLRKMFSKSKR